MARTVLAVATLLLISPLPAFSQSSDPAWLDELSDQIFFDKQCEVELVMNLRESTLGADNVYEARVRCGDGRMFDASRIGDYANFTFKACEIQVC